jgi:UDP-N-acetylglucosamine diphosphorylase / glucose-1-phosphate thymidylyltransferase / UDP-N-acetylgalactosamine diphosphorylase / glucosamine-1-phosphate N-acetyltransferase / galactosamine-1-phosphate N-acetyltransferase
MKAVILAAGEGKRMHPLTIDTPKPMLALAGRPLLEHLLDSLPASVDEVVLVVGYRADQIKKHFGDKFGRFKIHYVHQGKPEGTAKAIALCKDLIGQERFLSLYADDLHGKEDLEALLAHPLSVLVKEVPNPEQFGVVELVNGNQVLSIIEKPSKPTSDLVVTGPALLDARIFEFEPPKHANGEYFLAEAIGKLVESHTVVAVVQKFWLPIGYPKDLENAELWFKV